MNIANRIDIQNHPEFSVISFFGYVDAATTEQARGIIAAKLPEECCNIIVDLGKVEFLDSHGVGLFVSLLKRVHRNRGRLFFAAAAAQPMAVLNIVGFNGALVTYSDTMQEAQEEMNKKG